MRIDATPSVPSVLIAAVGTVIASSLLVLGASSTEAATPTCRGVNATIVGSGGADELDGTSGRDVIVGRGGSDDIEGHGGNDLICGGYGNDELEGQGGNDRLYGARSATRPRVAAGPTSAWPRSSRAADHPRLGMRRPAEGRRALRASASRRDTGRTAMRLAGRRGSAPADGLYLAAPSTDSSVVRRAEGGHPR